MKSVTSNANDQISIAERELEHALRTFFANQTPKTWVAPYVTTPESLKRPMTNRRGHWALAASLGLLLGGYAAVHYVSRTQQPGDSGKAATAIDIASPAHKKYKPSTKVRGPVFREETKSPPLRKTSDGHE